MCSDVCRSRPGRRRGCPGQDIENYNYLLILYWMHQGPARPGAAGAAALRGRQRGTFSTALARAFAFNRRKRGAAPARRGSKSSPSSASIAWTTAPRPETVLRVDRGGPHAVVGWHKQPQSEHRPTPSAKGLSMRIPAMAAGAVGGYFGARMAAAGHDGRSLRAARIATPSARMGSRSRARSAICISRT